jgi:small GTP-binding protein
VPEYQKRVIKKKICLLGDPAVGKTSLIRKYVMDKYDDEYISTLGTKVTKKEVEIKDDFNFTTYNLTFMIWDVLGQKEFKRIHQAAFQGTKGALIVCDLTRWETIQALEEWATNLFAVSGKVPMIFLGNKVDLVEDPNPEFITQVAEKYQAPFFLTSAKTGVNVDTAFTNLGEDVVKYI